jgi:hypothetical protein
MHTITSLRKALGLATANQVRNRIEAVRDLLEPHLRRGPNNQILLTDDGLALVRRLQDLYDSGLRMSEAGDVIRASAVITPVETATISPGFARYQAIPQTHQTPGAAVGGLQDEILFLRSRVVDLETRLASATRGSPEVNAAWWVALREDLDVA